MEISARARRAERRDGTLIEQARELAREIAAYYALYWWLWHKGGATVEELWRAYSSIVGRRVRFATVYKQLWILEDRYRAVRREGNRCVPLVPPEVLLPAVNSARARAGRLGAARRAVLATVPTREGLQVPVNLRHYVERVVSEVRGLLEKGDRTAAVDLVAHTLLPLRENEVLWLWRGEEFLYWDNKTHTFRCLRSKAVAEFLRDLGYGEGIMCWHVLGHGRASRIIRDLFGKGYLSWPWSRSIAYGLMLLGLLEEGNAYQVELQYEGGQLWLYLCDYYFGNTLAVYDLRWEHGEPPAPLGDRRTHYSGIAVGVPHTNPRSDSSYFSRWT